MYRFAGFTLDPQRAELRGADGVEIKLRRKTADMLAVFVANAGRVVTKQELMDAIWPNVHVSEDSLFQCVRELRTALGDEQRQTIKLISGRGYLFEPEVATGTAEIPASSEPAEIAAPLPVAASGASRRRPLKAIAIAAGIVVLIGAAAAAYVLAPRLIKPTQPVIALMPVTVSGAAPQDVGMATAITDQLIDGFSKIENIRLSAPRPGQNAPDQKSAGQTDFTVRGELQRTAQGWTLQARMIRTSTGEVETVATATSGNDVTDDKLRQSRLAAGVGHELAQRLNRILETSQRPFTAGDASTAKAAIEQAAASIHQTTRERFGMAQIMLQNAIDAEPDNIDIAVALVALQMRGIQMVWYSPDEAATVEKQAVATMERALKAKPRSIAVLETYCRFQSATNQFVESLVTCSRALDFDPWNGLSLFLVGLGQLHLGRFEDALATFERADRFDTPVISRWTWLLGIGWSNMMLGRYEAALPWTQRSIAITAASGRPHMLLAAIYQGLDRTAEAQAAMKQGLAIRPGTTAKTMPSPWTNASPIFVKRSNELLQLMIAAGLPEK